MTNATTRSAAPDVEEVRIFWSKQTTPPAAMITSEDNWTEEHAPVKAGPVDDLCAGNQIFIDVTHRPSLRANMTAEITALFCREGQQHIA